VGEKGGLSYNCGRRSFVSLPDTPIHNYNNDSSIRPFNLYFISIINRVSLGLPFRHTRLIIEIQIKRAIDSERVVAV